MPSSVIDTGVWQGTQKLSMRQQHKAGEQLFFDYCGPTIPVVNPDTGDLRDEQLFVATWGHPVTPHRQRMLSHAFAEATWSQNQADFINTHVHALEFFGGEPKFLVPDNLKAAVLKTHRYECRHIKTSRVHIDYHVDYGRHYYSVLFTLIKQEVEVHANSD